MPTMSGSAGLSVVHLYCLPRHWNVDGIFMMDGKEAEAVYLRGFCYKSVRLVAHSVETSFLLCLLNPLVDVAWG